MTQRWGRIEPWEIEVCLGIRLRKPRYFSIGFPIDGFFRTGNGRKKGESKISKVHKEQRQKQHLIHY